MEILKIFLGLSALGLLVVGVLIMMTHVTATGFDKLHGHSRKCDESETKGGQS